MLSLEEELFGSPLQINSDFAIIFLLFVPRLIPTPSLGAMT